ncbi:hypothetical protein IJG89_03405 [Candidatus Saccharibacteria bacterium]|nr:hypothetical protein [Candidatus Saccharibacteria bacterium]
MIRIFTGDDRVRAKNAIKEFLGLNYEVIDGANLSLNDLPSIFLGSSLFDAERKILLRDISENKSVFEKIPDYLNTPHKVAIFETKLDKRSSAYKILKQKVEIQDFILPANPNAKLIFNIYNTAKTNGPKALSMLSQIKTIEDPIRFAGLLNSQAIKDYAIRQGAKEKRALKELSKLDLELKSSKLPSWLLIESFLLRLSSW